MSRTLIPIATRGPISSVCMIDEPVAVCRPAAPDPAALQAQRKKMEQSAEALKKAAQQMETAGREVFASHREAVIQLAMEVAAKILARDIHEKNYQMEQILNEALKEIPAVQVRTVRLHPEDLETYQAYIKEHPEETLGQVHFVGDWSLGAAECIVETEQGLLDWLIDEQVRQVSEALLGHKTE